MLTALDADPATFDEGEKQFVANIREHGWFRTTVLAESDEFGFCYTTGFWATLGFPEIILFSLESSIAHDVLWDIFKDVKAGGKIPIGERTSNVTRNLDVVLLPIEKAHYATYLGWSRWFYAGDEFPCVQLVWPDRANQFPWQPDFDVEFAGDQPDLTPGWKPPNYHPSSARR